MRRCCLRRMSSSSLTDRFIKALAQPLGAVYLEPVTIPFAELTSFIVDIILFEGF